MPAPNKIARRSLLAGSAAFLNVSLATPLATPLAASLVASLVTFLATPVAVAAPRPSATPPAQMSTVGGARLGQAGTQVDLGAGAPVLPKGLTARSWIVADAETGDVLAAHNAHWRLPPASTLKMLFADTVLPKFPKSTEHKVVRSDLAGVGAGSSMVGVKENETYSVHDLWLGVFLRSGNDAVHVLSAMNDGVEETVKDMQAHAEELQALDTQVVSPDGYDAPEQVSSAYDLTLFARSGLQKKDFREYCSTVRAKFPGETKKVKGKKVRGTFEIQNTNRLLSGDTDVSVYDGIAGVKNGNTTKAGATFTGVAERGGRVLLVTVMNPQKNEHNEVYKETGKLFDWGFAAAGKVRPVGELVPPKSAAPAGGQPGATAPAAEAGGGTAQGAADGGSSAKPAGASATGGSSGAGIALAITGGLLVLLSGGVFLINRRWPLPDLVRRRTPRP
ncbi:D-alanyl-D-alanine carboxypeptidase family protein [Streptomyces sp. NPDC004629]|uniref:D-alanyl-D-alanine carboxypeptidase family protein n=1 Tax=Streptomyces sp. NPDC004629 TaxID=3364705 RepID=UPI00369C77B2